MCRSHAQEDASCKDRYGYTGFKRFNQNLIILSGDRIIVVVQKQRSFGSDSPGGGQGVGITNKVRRGDIRHAVVVRAKKEIQRKDGSTIRFDDNACVLINKTGDPIGTRITSVVGQELRDKQWSKILSLAPLHV